MTLKVHQRDFSATYRLDGVVQRSDHIDVDVPEGMAFTATGTAPRAVKAGEIMGSRNAADSASSEMPGSYVESLRQRSSLWIGEVRSPIAGAFSVVEGRPRITAAGIDVVVAFTPLQEMRFRSMRYDGEATVETPAGQYSAPCKALWLQQPPAGPPGGGGEDTNTSAVAAWVHCRLPSWVETAVGLRARVSLNSRPIANALLVPAIAISYDEESDQPYVTVVEGDAETKVPISLGATDGVMRVVSGKITAGQVLKRAAAS